MPSTIFRPAIPALDRPQTHALDRMVTGINFYYDSYIKPNTLLKNVNFLNVTVDGTFTYLVITRL
jgi:hypothetical protein